MANKKPTFGGKHYAGGRTKGTILPSQTLAAARYVANNEPNTEEETGLVKMYRTQQQDDPAAFLKALEKMELEYKKEVQISLREAKKAAVGSGGEDLGTDACIRMAEQLLREYESS